ncbi:hypothetical protein N7462_002112 [Penicillium macrosclerotiorum]|uniref:uncharacterized protein n=1 Tax=Penicillium macrosclerotiorum TaxID=303699 RepID=UPI0025465C64|nr:uncharacterized protein N7462_002112 [Penicillium macrosclerotiorum]KAJ5692689.1 hypothetical protein N7462_002112 [Penicillium macrosclerotiorum]
MTNSETRNAPLIPAATPPIRAVKYSMEYILTVALYGEAGRRWWKHSLLASSGVVGVQVFEIIVHCGSLPPPPRHSRILLRRTRSSPFEDRGTRETLSIPPSVPRSLVPNPISSAPPLPRGIGQPVKEGVVSGLDW